MKRMLYLLSFVMLFAAASACVAADDPNTRELRRTLRAYLKTRNAKEAASQLVDVERHAVSMSTPVQSTRRLSPPSR